MGAGSGSRGPGAGCRIQDFKFRVSGSTLIGSKLFLKWIHLTTPTAKLKL